MREEARTKKELIHELQSLKKANTRLKRQLKNAEEKYNLFFENSFVPTVITSLDGKKVLDANNEAVKLAGYSSKDEFLKGFTTGEINADPQTRHELFSELQSTGKVSNKEYQFFKKDGTPLWVEFNAQKYHPKKWLVVEGIDITKRKKFENNLKKAQRELKKKVKKRTKELEHTRDFLENIFHTSVEGCMVVDVQGNITMVNPAMEELLGYSRDELVGKSAWMVRPKGKEYEEKAREFIEKLFEDGYVRELERKWQKKDGSLIDVEINGALLKDEAGNHIGGVGSFRNITEHKKADQELKESKEFLESIFKASVDGIMVSDQEGRITMVNESAEKMFGYSKDELVGMHTGELAIEDQSYKKEGEKIIGELMEKGTVSGVLRKWVRKDGSVVDLEMNIALLSKEEGTFQGAVGIIRDISERKLMEEALKKSEAKYRELVENSNSAILRMDLEGNVAFFNKFAQDFFGFTEEEIIGKNVVGTIVPERESTGRDLAFMIRDIGIHPEKYKNNENENMCSNGERVWISWTNNVVVDERNRIKELLCFGNDITERKHAEEELQETKEFLDNIIESSLDSIVIADTKGYIIRANNAFLALIGCENVEQVVGKHIMEFAPQERGIYESTTGNNIEIGDSFFEDTEVWMSELVEGGKITTLETFHINNDNTIIPVEDTVSYIYNNEGARLGTVGIIRDVTERKRAEEKLNDYQNQLRSMSSQLTVLEERERKKFATYIHDQIGQTLFSAKIQLEALRETVPHKDGQKSVNEVTALLEQVIKDSRNLTFEVGAPILYQFGIEAALKGLVEKVNKNGEISALYKSDETIRSLDEDVSIFLFRAVQELLSNIVKHAHAHNVESSIFSKGKETCVSVKDDGIGFRYSEPDTLMTEDYGFGLFSIKERLIPFGGHLLVESTVRRGTCVTLRVPQKDN